MSVILAGGFSVVSFPGSSWLRRSLSRLSRFPIALKLLKNRQATQANNSSTLYQRERGFCGRERQFEESITLGFRAYLGNHYYDTRYQSYIYAKWSAEERGAFWNRRVLMVKPSTYLYSYFPKCLLRCSFEKEEVSVINLWKCRRMQVLNWTAKLNDNTNIEDPQRGGLCRRSYWGWTEVLCLASCRTCWGHPSSESSLYGPYFSLWGWFRDSRS